MFNFNRDYLTKLYGLCFEFEGFSMNFKDKELEIMYVEQFTEKEIKKSRIFNVYVVLLYLYNIYNALSKNNYIPLKTTNFTYAALILEFIFFMISCYYGPKTKQFYINKIIRFFLIYAIMLKEITFPSTELTKEKNISNFYRCFMNILGIFLIFLDFNYFIMIIVPIINLLTIVYVQYTQEYEKYYLLPDFIGAIFYQSFFFLLKKNELYNEKIKFFEFQENNQYIEYIKQLVDVLCMKIISFKKNYEILFMNKFASSFFEKYISNSVQPIKLSNTDKELLFDDSKLKMSYHLSKYMNDFFESLFIDSSYNEFNSEKKGKNLHEILNEILLDDNYNKEIFKRIGNFKIKIEESNYFYEIYARKLKFKEEIVELLFYDVTEVKLSEKIKAETKYKQKILGKIAHEFKTPLITIISLINNIVEYQKNHKCNQCGIAITNKLDHIANFSNYTIFLINDIIQYVSGSNDLKFTKLEINTREVLNFCHSVMKTLVECNEAKAHKIETKLLIDDEIDRRIIISDENRIKQILLNLISNSVKFTHSGYVKLKAKYLRESNDLEFTVKDTGVGIKPEEKHLIFQENIQLNLDQVYNVKGSGLGLSICKTLANSLGHDLNFYSILKKGTKFKLIIKCLQEEKIKNNIKYSDEGIKMKSIILNNDYININNLSLSNIKNDNMDVCEKKSNSYHSNQKDISNDKANKLILDKTPICNKTLNINDISNYILNELNDNNVSSDLLQLYNFSFNIRSIKFYDSNLTIVVVDDNKYIRQNTVNLVKSVFSILKIDDYSIIEGSDGIDIPNIVNKDIGNNIKCILTDENMTHLNGSEAVQIVRKLEEKNNLCKNYIVSLTAFDDQDTKNYIMKLGMNLIISKPMTKSSIMNILNNIQYLKK